jgi:hypothetical protein
MLCRFRVEDINRLKRIQNRLLKLAFDLERRLPTLDLFAREATRVLPILGIGCNLLLLIKKDLLSVKSDFEVTTEGRRSQNLWK